MIVRAKTPKGLSWAGRLAVLGMAALLLPLAPSWAQNRCDRHPTSPTSLKRRQTPCLGDRADQSVEDRIAKALESDPELAIIAREIEMAREQLDQIHRGNRVTIDRVKQQLEKLRAEIEDKKGQLKELFKNGKIAVLKPGEFLNTKNDGDASRLALRKVTETPLKQMIQEMIRTDFELYAAQSKLEVMLAERDAMGQEGDGLRLASKRSFIKTPRFKTCSLR